MRNYSTGALVLALQPKGESNRTATLLTPDEGIVRATLYGGAKSRMRSLVSPMNTGEMWLSRDDSRRTVKIGDFRVDRWRLSLRESLVKAMQANVMAELLIRTHCAGSPERAWVLANAFLDGMDHFGEEESRRGFVRFLWRYLGLLGERPQPDECGSCGAEIPSTRPRGGTSPDGVSWKEPSANGNPGTGETLAYDRRERAFLCADCAAAAAASAEAGRLVRLSAEAVAYLRATAELSPGAARTAAVGEEALGGLKRLCLDLVQEACGARLKSVEASADFL